MTQKLSTRGSRVQDAIRTLTPFRTHGALEGTDKVPYYAGRLTGTALANYTEGTDERLIDYVVLSYSTPIAWHMPGIGWTYVDRDFSPTTGRHQYAVRAALHGLSDVTVLQKRYTLSPTAMEVLYRAHARPEGPVGIHGVERQAVKRLAAEGLVTDHYNDTVTVTDAGREVFA